MNNIAVLKSKGSFSIILLYSFLNIFLSIKNVKTYRFAYTFERNENSRILFFEELRSIDKEKKPIFIYKKDKFIKFKSLDNILMANSTIRDSVRGIIMCSYELSYYLKLSKDITELPDKFGINKFRFLLKTFKFLNAVENKNIRKFFEILIFKEFACQNKNNSKECNFYFDEIFKSGFLTDFDINMKMFILNEMNIKSLIINGNIACIIPYKKYYFRILSLGLFKSLVIANFDSPPRSFLYELDSVIDKNIEFLSLRKLAISRYTVETLLMKEKHKGLVFNMNINFGYVLINNSWWNDFFRCGVAKKIIIEFDNLYTEKKSMDEFFDVKILTDFCDSLSNFNDLQTLKLDRYEIDKDTYGYLLRMVESMQQLENLTLIQVINDAKYYNFSLKHSNIKSLHLENNSLNNKIILEDFL
ncbi:hypothetical protein CWI36_1031p0020 [Hamiltosporidium magnivora]|uniref:Uncharacterized protein n=1 Tax=Hamiltosporidium magnivora TaxID=148818 RepID=A0A4Q9L7I7_9MICR|nr:hypothetical protein CWI36_1031p0020 [Hamiltosporidium magnivora]